MNMPMFRITHTAIGLKKKKRKALVLINQQDFPPKFGLMNNGALTKSNDVKPNPVAAARPHTMIVRFLADRVSLIISRLVDGLIAFSVSNATVVIHMNDARKEKYLNPLRTVHATGNWFTRGPIRRKNMLSVRARTN